MGNKKSSDGFEKFGNGLLNVGEKLGNSGLNMIMAPSQLMSSMTNYMNSSGGMTTIIMVGGGVLVAVIVLPLIFRK